MTILGSRDMARYSKLLFLVFFIINFQTSAREKKDWTFIVYVAADNNLRDFAPRNIKQMGSVGSNKNINILVHVDIRLSGQKKMTRRYIVNKGDTVQVDMPNEKLPMDSGDPQSLISACNWAITEFPAEHYALIFWNHGTGIIDPYGKRSFNTNNLIVLNPQTGTFELDRSYSYIDLIEESVSDPKGICWDDSTGNYLTNQKLEFALQEITTKNLGGAKFDIIGFDACLMAMLEVAEIIKRYANIMIASQEVEPGPGQRYDEALSLFYAGSPDPITFARHWVNSFAKAYKVGGISMAFADYTQSALDLNAIEPLEKNIDKLGQLFLKGLTEDPQNYRTMITNARAKRNCTHFNEPTYIDLNHFYQNILKSIIAGAVKGETAAEIRTTIEIGINLINKAVIHNASGPHLAGAKGISIYFPEKRIHPSYKKSNFAKNTWAKFMTSFLLS